ncbi:MAG: SGNH/GDSL hydrolase family protein, partial [bacterium]
TKSFSLDQHGFREALYDPDRKKNAMVAGGSAAFGWGLENNEKTFVYKLGQLNNEYNFVNASVSGYLSGQELSQMVHYLDDFEPAFYIVFDGWDDINDPYMFTDKWPVDFGPIGFNNTFFMIEENLGAHFQKYKKWNTKDPQIKGAGKPLGRTQYFDEICKKYSSNISKMNSFAASRKAVFLLVFQPELGNKKRKSKEELVLLKSWNASYGYLDRETPAMYKIFVERAKESFSAEKIPFIDINEYAEFSEDSTTLFFDCVHPNNKGHEIIAGIISDAVAGMAAEKEAAAGAQADSSTVQIEDKDTGMTADSAAAGDTVENGLPD